MEIFITEMLKGYYAKRIAGTKTTEWEKIEYENENEANENVDWKKSSKENR